MGLRHSVPVYFGLADETPEERRARQTSLLQTSPARRVLNAVVGVLVACAVVGLIGCLLDGETVTLLRVIEKGWLVAVALTMAGVARERWDLRLAKRELDEAQRPRRPRAG
jgi:hypothetical protein